jgi:hypothetical protein
MLARAASWRARTRVVEESTGVVVDQGGGRVGQGADWVVMHRPRSAKGGGQGSHQWPPSVGLAEAMDDLVKWCSSWWRPSSGRSEHGHATASWRRRARQRRVLGGRGATDGEGARVGRRWGRERQPARSGYERVCGPGEDGVGGRAREDGGKSEQRRQLDLAGEAQARAWAHVLG